jgi:hypothetical protein
MAVTILVLPRGIQPMAAIKQLSRRALRP